MSIFESMDRMFSSTQFPPPSWEACRAAWLNERTQGIRAELIYPHFPRDFALPVAEEDWEE